MDARCNVPTGAVKGGSVSPGSSLTWDLREGKVPERRGPPTGRPSSSTTGNKDTVRHESKPHETVLTLDRIVDREPQAGGLERNRERPDYQTGEPLANTNESIRVRQALTGLVNPSSCRTGRFGSESVERRRAGGSHVKRSRQACGSLERKRGKGKPVKKEGSRTTRKLYGSASRCLAKTTNHGDPVRRHTEERSLSKRSIT
jgi:hypothetical protein